MGANINRSGTPPQPRSPPDYPDVCGKHRLQVAVRSLDQEIHSLQSELNSIEGTLPASRCCKELNEYVGTHPDPLIKVYEKRSRFFRDWKIFRAILCCSWGWICCTRGCLFYPERPKRCCHMQLEDIIFCRWCSLGCTSCNCCKISCCNLDPLAPCPECSCGCACSCSRCAETCICSLCTGCSNARCIC